MTQVAWPILIAASALLADVAFTQQTGMIQGTVSDEQGNVVVGASIKVWQRPFVADTKTDAIGTFVFDTLATGPYTMQIIKPGLCMSTLVLNPVSAVGIFLVPVVLKTPEAQGDPVSESIPVMSAQQRPRAVRTVSPDYPEEALAAGLGGTVTVEVTLDDNGVPIVVTSESDRDPRLVQAAVDAAKQWRYRSTSVSCEPVQVETQIHFNFSPATGQVRL